MSSREIASRYAKALMMAPANQDELVNRLKFLEEISRLIDETDQLKYFLMSPQVSDLDKEALLKTALQDPVLINLLWELLKKHRLEQLKEITEQYKYKVHHKLNLIEAYLVSPTPVDSKIQDELKERLEKHFNKKVKLLPEEDPRLIGGGSLLIGNQSIDFSIKDRLERLKKAMMSVKVETKKA